MVPIEFSHSSRAFDGAATIAASVEHVSDEGQGPMILESLACGEGECVPLPLIKVRYGS